jgi:hypothetical protein
MTCVISDAGTVTLPEYLSSLLVFSELGNKSNMTCVISDAGTVTLRSTRVHTWLLVN